MSVLKKYWFLLGLVILLPAGILLAKSPVSDALTGIVESIPTSVCTGLILFLMAITLDNRRLVDSLRRPGPVLTATGINQGLLPLACLPLIPIVPSADLKLGLLIACSVPCTMAAASVWTRRAGGNDAVSLLVTLITNGFCFLITPAWLSAGSHLFELADTSQSLSFGSMVLRLTLSALLPAIAGQLLRLRDSTRFHIDRNKATLSTIAQAIILTLVFISAFKGGLRFGGMGDNVNHGAMAFVWSCCIVLHLVAMLISRITSRVFRFSEPDTRAVMFASSQKTLPIGLLVSQASGLPLSIIPMLMFHGSQLFIDTWIADRLQRGDSSTHVSHKLAQQENPK